MGGPKAAPRRRGILSESANQLSLTGRLSSSKSGLALKPTYSSLASGLCVRCIDDLNISSRMAKNALCVAASSGAEFANLSVSQV